MRLKDSNLSHTECVGRSPKKKRKEANHEVYHSVDIRIDFADD